MTNARIAHALDLLDLARSTIIDHLSFPNDAYARMEILQDLDAAAEAIRKVAA